jgi:hypothetical protein
MGYNSSKKIGLLALFLFIKGVIMKHRSIPLCIFLSIITFGIFFLYWFYSVIKDLVKELEYEKIDSPGLNILFLILCNYFYYLWWNYKVSAYLIIIEDKNNIKSDFWATPLSILFGHILHQSRINRILATKYAKKTAPRKRTTKKVTKAE